MNGRVVLVTGSTRGIGLLVARACAARGARVVVHGRDAARVATVAEELGGVGIDEDLAVAGGGERLVARALAACGAIDVLVNNAGGSGRAGLAAQSAALLAATVATNLVAPLAITRALLASSGGRTLRIVNVSSAIVAMPRADAAAYLASKAGLEAATRALALEVGETVTITAVALAGHQTELARAMLAADEYARLPPAESAAAELLHAIGAPREAVHGRVLGPVAAAPPLEVGGLDLLAHPLGPSPRARAALVDAARTSPLERYPAPPAELRKVIAARCGVPLDAVVVGAGTSELLERILGVVAAPGETAIAHTPTWPLWPYACRARGIAWRPVPYAIVDGRADHALAAIADALDAATRVVYLTSPANPGGAAIDAAAFTAFLARVPRHVTVIVDEAYVEYATRQAALDATKLVRWSDASLVVLRSFSKFYGLAGLRIGYAISTGSLARRLAAAAPPFPLVAGAEAAAIAALGDVGHARATLATIAEGRADLERELRDRGVRWLASDAPFVLAALPAAEHPGPRYFDGEYVMLPLPWAIERTATTR